MPPQKARFALFFALIALGLSLTPARPPITREAILGVRVL